MKCLKITVLFFCAFCFLPLAGCFSDTQNNEDVSVAETAVPERVSETTQELVEDEVSFVPSEQSTVKPDWTAIPAEAPTPEPTIPASTESPAPEPTPEPEQIRQDLTSLCKFGCSQKSITNKLLTDNNLRSSVILENGTEMTYSWKETVCVDALYLFAYTPPDAFRIIQRDSAKNVLSDEEVKPARMCFSYPIEEGCRMVTVQSIGRSKINDFRVFGQGSTFPEHVVWWTPTEERDHCDLLLVSTHFDDEILMMGGVLPIYAGEQKRDCAVIYMVNEDDRVRQMEAMQGLWEMGVKREPIALSFTFRSMEKALENDASGVFKKDDLATVVKLLRQIRPLVVVTHDVDGEYGHREHIKTSAIVRRAVELASDPNYDPASAAEYGIWQVQKEYIHLWKENPLELDIRSPLPHMGGRSAYAVAAKAFTYHKTQQKWFLQSTNKAFPIGSFGLYFTSVGPDSGINDMFENTGFSEENKPSDN